MIKTNSNLQYSAPVCKTIEVRFEQRILEGSPTFQVNPWEEDDSDDLGC